MEISQSISLGLLETMLGDHSGRRWKKMEEDGRSWKKLEEDGRWKKRVEKRSQKKRRTIKNSKVVGDGLGTLVGVRVASKK